MKTKTFPIVHVSTMTGKLDGLRAISTNTRTNDYCIKQNASGDSSNICTKCYSHTMLSSYRKNMQPALQRNSDALGMRVLAEHEIPRILDSVFRFDAHGELINDTHLGNLVAICEANPGTNFALWTKRNDLVSKHFATRAKPANMILIYSNPKISNIMRKPPRHFDRTFNNVLEHEFTERQNCTGQQCKDCLLCYIPGNGVTTIVEKVKKY
jgi:hypothetical protein